MIPGGFQRHIFETGAILAVQGCPSSFTASSNLPRSEVLRCRDGLPFTLFYFGTSNTQAPTKPPLPRGITAPNASRARGRAPTHGSPAPPPGHRRSPGAPQPPPGRAGAGAGAGAGASRPLPGRPRSGRGLPTFGGGRGARPAGGMSPAAGRGGGSAGQGEPPPPCPRSGRSGGARPSASACCRPCSSSACSWASGAPGARRRSPGRRRRRGGRPPRPAARSSTRARRRRRAGGGSPTCGAAGGGAPRPAAAPCSPRAAAAGRLGNDDNQFEISMANSGCEVHRFDPSIKSAHIQEGRHLWYHRLSIDWRDPNPAIAAHKLHSNTKKLGTILNEFGHQKIDVLKADVESAEWKILENLILEDVVEQIGQLVFEVHIHWPGFEVSGNDSTVVRYWYSLLRELELKDFKLFHTYKDLSKPQMFLKKEAFNASSCYTLSWVNTRWT
uniref:Methyltransferase like 24 n=1 Tax=Falco tinnunculus TaxID=100819 RepID=A0A8C4U491_FALTI